MRQLHIEINDSVTIIILHFHFECRPRRHAATNSAIHKAAGLTVPRLFQDFDWYNSCGTQKYPLAVNGSHWQQPPLGGIPAGGFLGTAGN